MDTVLDKVWEVYALKYAERSDRTRGESFIFDDHSSQAHTIDYFVWLLKSEDDAVIVDTGYDYDEAKRRNSAPVTPFGKPARASSICAANT